MRPSATPCPATVAWITEGVEGEIEATNMNGPITLTDVAGSADVNGSFGEVRVTQVKRGVKIVSGNGRVTLRWTAV